MRHVLTLSLVGVVLCLLSVIGTAVAQEVYHPREVPVIDPGTTIQVRTSQPIQANGSDGQVFSAVVAQDIFDRHHYLTIQKGSAVELIVRKAAGNDLALDLDSIMLNGEKYAVQTDEDSSRYKGEAETGAIIGVLAGGKGVVPPGTRILTKGQRIVVPADSLLTFRLSEPLRPAVEDRITTQ
jgi:hypothetical protein